MVRFVSWLISPLSILKTTLSVSLFLSALFLMDGRLQWLPYTLIFLFCLAAAFLCLLSLIGHYFELTSLREKETILVEATANMVLGLISLLTTILLGWDFVRMNDGHWQHHSRLPPRNIGQAGWKGRVVIVLGCAAVNCVLFLLVFLRIRQHGLK